MILEREGPSPNLQELHDRARERGLGVRLAHTRADRQPTMHVLFVYRIADGEVIGGYGDERIETAALNLLVMLDWDALR